MSLFYSFISIWFDEKLLMIPHWNIPVNIIDNIILK